MFRRIDCMFKTIWLTLKHNSIGRLNRFEVFPAHDYIVVFEDGKSQDGSDSNIEYAICEYCGKEVVTLMNEEDFYNAEYVKSGDYLRDRRKDAD